MAAAATMSGNYPHQSNMNNDLMLEARPSRFGQNQNIQADGDTWQETLAVCEAPPTSHHEAGKLIIRSYYQNTRSGKRVWDEPPSGASNVLPASEEMRKMAEIQLQELHVVTGRFQEEETSSPTPTASPNNGNKKGKDKKKKGFFNFGRKKNKKNSNRNLNDSDRKIEYKPGSKLFARKTKPNPSSSSSRRSDQNDSQLQEAIARSLAESQGVPYSAAPVPAPAAPAVSNPDDEELAMAKALSLSQAQQQHETEDMILQRVLEESKNDTPKKGMPRGNPVDLLGLTPPAAAVGQSAMLPATSNHSQDRKLPARKMSPPPPSSQNYNHPPPPDFVSFPAPVAAAAASYPPATVTVAAPTPAASYAAAPAAVSYPPATAAVASTYPPPAAAPPASLKKAPPAYAPAALKKPPPQYAATAPHSPVRPSRPSAAVSPTRSPVAAQFDPYAKDAPPPQKVNRKPAPKSTADSGQALQKMSSDYNEKNGNQKGPSTRLSFRRPGTVKKMQDKAGVV